MQTISTHFEAELKKRIDEYIKHVSDILAVGTAVENYAQYQRYVGEINALNRVTSEFFGDVNKVLNER